MRCFYNDVMSQIAPSMQEIEHADLTIRHAADVDQFEVPCVYGLDRLRIISPAFGRSRNIRD